jgi:hypothetical protein
MITATNSQHRQSIGQHFDLVGLLNYQLCPADIAIRNNDAEIKRSNSKTYYYP